MQKTILKVFIILFFVLSSVKMATPSLFFQSQDTISEIQTQNLSAFAKLYGYIRFFHPSDESAEMDWDKFAVFGVEEIKKIKTHGELIDKLKQLFLPIAPTAMISSTGETTGISLEPSLKDTSGLKIISWQHYGVWLSRRSNIYKSIRTIINSKIIDKDTVRFSKQKDNSQYKNIQNYRLFENIPNAFECYNAKVDSGIYCKVPLTLLYDGSHTLGKNIDYNYDSLINKINNLNIEKAFNTHDNIWLADIIITWNIIQHFYPYFDTIVIDWEKILDETLRETVLDKSDEEFSSTLSKMMAKLQDGHAFVSNKNKQVSYGLPIRVEFIQNQIVVVATEDTLFHKGDIIKNLDGTDALEILQQIEQHEPGSKQLKEYMACIDFGQGSVNSPVELEIIRNDSNISINTKRVIKPDNFFRTRLSEYNFEPIKRIADGIYYLNLLTVDQKQFDDSLKVLSNAKGIIFDLRWTSVLKENAKMFNPNMIVGNLCSEDITTERFYTPAIVYPDRVKMSFIEDVFPIYPDTPYFKSKNIFLVDPNVISHLETFLGTVKQYHLGEIVGRVTAGVNGNINPIILPGGFETMFTGLKVLNHDGSQHHLMGIKPDYIIKKTIQAVREGRDEYLEKAMEVLKEKLRIE
jgi:C-terminal processing protease CtpA/Prc